MRNQRTSKRAYGYSRRSLQRHSSVRTFSLPSHKTTFKLLLTRLRRLTTLQVVIVCLAVLAFASVTVALAVGKGAGTDTKEVSVQGTAILTPSLPATPSPSPESQSEDPAGGDESLVSPSDPASSPSPSPSPSPTPPPDPANTVIRPGMNAPVVVDIQSRLMDLDYMDEDEPTDYFGPVTSSAISLFQRQHKLSVDGSVGPETYHLLMSDEAQHYTIMEGASGDDVKDLQGRLRELGYLNSVTGKFGEQTTQAVKNFQQVNGLAKDGKVGQKTRELIFSADAKAYFLQYGAQSDKVKTYQKRLKALGYLTTTPDGNYGQDTVAAVKRFQDVNGLTADGFLGPDAVSLLLSKNARANALVLGMKGNDVENVQKRLKALGYISHVTGYFGSETESGVKAFQKKNKLSADGTVGSQTMSKLNSSSAKKASAGTSGSSSSSSSTGVEKLISTAQSKLGAKYVWGAKGSSTFDCSGFIYYCLNKSGVKQSYLTSAGWASSSRYQKIKSISSLKRGDILVFKGDSVGHVGIYQGNGRMIDASSSHGKVVERSGIWDGSYWRDHFICGFRVY